MESERMLTPKEKSPLVEAQRRVEPVMLHHTGQQAQQATNWAILAPFISWDHCMCCHTETGGADQTYHLTQSCHTDTRPTSPRADLITPGRAAARILFYSRLCPSTAGRSHLPESSIFLCPLLSLSIPLPVAPQCHHSNDVLVFQLILHPLSAILCF